jgi:hypothetical protein
LSNLLDKSGWNVEYFSATSSYLKLCLSDLFLVKEGL